MRRSAFVVLVCWFGAGTVSACLYDYGDYDFEDETDDTSSPASPTPTVPTQTAAQQSDAGIPPG